MTKEERWKYILMGLIVVYVIVVFVYTSGSDKPFSAVKKQVEKTIDTGEMQDVSERGLKRYYGLNSADYDGVMLYISDNSMSAQEVLLVKVKDSSQAGEVEAAVTERLKNRENVFAGYAPDEVKLLKSAERSTRGDYIFLAVMTDAQKYKKAFSKSL